MEDRVSLKYFANGRRYYKKLKDFNLNCYPYQMPLDAWKNDQTKYPDLEVSDIYV